MLTFDTSMSLSLANNGHSVKVEPVVGDPSFLPSSCFGWVIPRLLRATIENGGVL